MKLAHFISMANITMKCTPLGRRTTVDRWTHDAWKCIIRRNNRRMQVTFQMGVAHEGEEPPLDLVLDSLASDAAGYENANGDFTEWAAEYGMDRKIFRAVERQSDRLRNFLGDSLYETLLWKTERE